MYFNQSRHAREKVKQEFALEKVSAVYQRLYGDVLGRETVGVFEGLL